MPITKDRDYWRCATTTALIEEARDSDHELAIALGERLEDACAPPEGAWQTPAHLQATIDTLRAELAAAESELDRLRADNAGDD